MYSWLQIEGDGCVVTIEQRPPHCNRGRVYAKVNFNPEKVAVSEADPWPRYYFYVKHAIHEVVCWMHAHGAVDSPKGAQISLQTLEDGKPCKVMDCEDVDDATSAMLSEMINSGNITLSNG